MNHRPYNDPAYRAAKAQLRTQHIPCQLRRDGCTGRATTPDHQPRLNEHTHIRNTGCCQLIPACHHCNTSDGAEHGNRQRHADTLGLATTQHANTLRL